MEAHIRKGRRALFYMQTFSTLGFSVLYSTLVLYATEGLKLSSHYATALTGGFIAFNYSLHVLGGYIGGRLLSYRGLFTLGMLLQIVSFFAIAVPTAPSLVWGMSIFLAGNGLNVICINCMLTQLFDPLDKRRESAFLWNYSGMNLGFFIGFTVSGFFQLHHDFHTLFLLSAGGGLISLVLTLLNWKHLRDVNTHYSHSRHRVARICWALLLVLALITILTFLLVHANLSNILISIAGVIVAGVFAYFAWEEKVKTASRKLWAYLILAVSSLIFWTLYQMAPMGLTLFYNRNVDHVLLGFTIPPQWIQNINTVVIVFGAPLMAALNQRLRKKGISITIPFQFTTALLLIGFGFLLLPLGIYLANSQGYSSMLWVVACYVFQSIGELFISPIGYAMVGQLIPSRLQGLAMGAWLMVTGVAATLSNYFSQMALGSTETKNPLITNASYSSIFLQLGIYAIIGGIILFFLRPFLHKLIQEKFSLKRITPAPYDAPQD